MVLNRKRAILLLILASVGWSLGGVLIKLVNWDPFGIAGVRSAIAGLFILAVCGKPKFRWSATQIFAGVAHGATITCYALANTMTTAANAVLLPFASPVYVAILSTWFLGERTKRSDWLIIAVVLVGLALFFVPNLRAETGTVAGNYLLGNLLSLGSGVAWAFVVILLRKQKDGSTLESLILGCAISAAVCLAISFRSLTLPSCTDVVLLIILGLVQLGLPWFLYGMAIRVLGALESVLILMLEPILNPLWAFIFISEKPGPWSLFGGAVVLAGITFKAVQAARSTGKSRG